MPPKKKVSKSSYPVAFRAAAKNCYHLVGHQPRCFHLVLSTQNQPFTQAITRDFFTLFVIQAKLPQTTKHAVVQHMKCTHLFASGRIQRGRELTKAQSFK
jgi:hypothetical protein